MENSKIKIAVLWTAVMCGFALHTLADLLPLFWSADVAVDASGAAPAGLLTFMMVVSYLLPVAGILCVLFGRSRAWSMTNAVLATAMLVFDLFHTGELFAGFNPVQLPLLPVILVAGGFLCRESWRIAERRSGSGL